MAGHYRDAKPPDFIGVNLVASTLWHSFGQARNADSGLEGMVGGD
jgi:hypothetical protein